MENMELDIYKNKRIFVTGHTGFKGSWLCLMLEKLGAEVIGYSNGYPTPICHYKLLNLPFKSIFGDIRDKSLLKKSLEDTKPDFIFHLAAQPLVRQSYLEPVETFETNILGTVNILDSMRTVDSIKGLLNITTDKCYENKDWIYGYRENDRLGGSDPYSSSKACSELITESYRQSFFGDSKLIATARSGNVVGGGDWGMDRLIPDLIKSFEKNEQIVLRYPDAVRPWQHALDPLYGYLILGSKLLQGNDFFASSWNFGPLKRENYTVKKVVQIIKKQIPINFKVDSEKNYKETNFLTLDCSKSIHYLHWKPNIDGENIFNWTMSWYKNYFSGKISSRDQIKEYFNLLKLNFNRPKLGPKWEKDEYLKPGKLV